MEPAELKTIRGNLSLTQEQLANELGVHRFTVIRWEAGTLKIRPMLVLAIQMLEQRFAKLNSNKTEQDEDCARPSIAD